MRVEVNPKIENLNDVLFICCIAFFIKIIKITIFFSFIKCYGVIWFILLHKLLPLSWFKFIMHVIVAIVLLSHVWQRDDYFILVSNDQIKIKFVITSVSVWTHGRYCAISLFGLKIPPMGGILFIQKSGMFDCSYHTQILRCQKSST